MLVRSEQWPSTFFASSLESFLRGLPPRVRKVSQVSYQFTCNMLSHTRRYKDIHERFLRRPKRKEELECLITKLQAKQKVFGDKFSAAYALDLMNKFIRKVIREHLVGIYETDQVFGEFLCHVFFRRRTHIDDENKGEMWQETKEPLYCLLVAAYVSNAMAHTFSDQEDFRQNHEYYESIAWSIFDEMYQNNEVKREYHVLAFDYESIYKDKLGMNEKGELVTQWKRQKKIYEQWQKSSRELLCVAYRGQCMKFVSHVACQNYIEARWKYGKVGRLFDVEGIHTGTPIETRNRISTLLKHCKSWLTVVFWTPQSKYLIHMFFNLVFIVFFAMALLKKPWRQLVEPDQKDGAFNLWTFAFFYVLVSLILETAEQVLKIFYILRKGWHKAYWWVNYGVRFLRFALFAANCISLTLAASIKIYSSFFFPVCEILFTASFVLSTITTLKYFSFSDYFGAKIQLIREMANSIFKYMAILVVFWIIYAVCYLSLTEGISVNQETTVWQLFQSGVFEILGESRDEDRDGTISECSNVRWQSVDFEKPDQVRCLFRSSLIPPLLFLYMMTATIMLINIFTAMLSHEYEVSNQNATNYSRFHKYEILARFESKIFFPRPLNIIYIVGWIFYKIGSWLKCERYVRCSCCKDLSDVFPFNIVISWFSSVRSWGSSPKDAKVNEEEVRILRELVLDKRGTHDFVDAVQKLITDWKHRKPESPGQDRIEEAHKVLEGVIGKFKDFLSTETEGVRRRVDTALEEIRSTTPALTEVLRGARNTPGATGIERAAGNP